MPLESNVFIAAEIKVIMAPTVLLPVQPRLEV